MAKIDKHAVRKRRAAARAERGVQIWPEPDGMCTIKARLPEEQARAVFGVIDTFAHANRTAGDERGIDARADALVDLILDPAGRTPGSATTPASR